MQQLYSWTDAYLALADAFGAARGWLEDIDGGQRVRRCPATTNADVILLGAIFGDAIAKARGARGSDSMSSRWEVCSTNIEHSALPPADARATYHHDKTLWSCFKEASLYLDHAGYPPPSHATWDAIAAQIADPIDHGQRNRWRNDWRTDVKVSETSDGRVTFEGWKTYDDLYLAQWDYFRRKRGADQVNGEPIPRTTNADVLQLGTFWLNALATNEGAGDRPGMMQWDTPVAAWRAASAHVAADAIGHDPNATYAHNEELWRAIDDVSSVLTVGKRAPTKAELLVRAFERSVAHLPQNVGKGLQWLGGEAEHAVVEATGAAGRATHSLLGGMFGSLKWPLLLGGGAVGAYLLTRNRASAASTTTPRAPKEGA
jgi:hypothetical protein